MAQRCRPPFSRRGRWPAGHLRCHVPARGRPPGKGSALSRHRHAAAQWHLGRCGYVLHAGVKWFLQAGPACRPARRAVAVDGKERKLAKAGGQKKVHLLAAVTHIPGLVIAQDKVAKSGKANEITHFKPLLAPLPLDGVLITSDAMQANRDNALFLRKAKKAHYLWPILGNQPNLNAQLNTLPWVTTPVAAVTSEISRGRIETRTIRVLPAPEDTGFEDARQALLIERYTTYKKKGQWHTRAEAVLCITSLAADETTPEDLLAHVRGHWRVEHAHWLRSPGTGLAVASCGAGATRVSFSC